MVYFVKFDKKDRIKDENTRSLLMIVDWIVLKCQFQLYRGMNKSYKVISSTTRPLVVYKTIGLYVQIKKKG